MDNVNNKTHSTVQLRMIEEHLREHGVNEFRLLLSNDNYACTKDGRFFRVCRVQRSKAGREIRKYEVVELTGSVDRYGYQTYRIRVGDEKKHLKGHRELLKAWTGHDREQLVVNHINGVKSDNRLANLEWCTVAENNLHAVQTGLNNPSKIKRRYAINPCDWTTVYALWKYGGLSFSELGRKNRCSKDVVGLICRRVDALVNHIKGVDRRDPRNIVRVGFA